MGNISLCLGKEELVKWCEIQPWDSYLWQVMLFLTKTFVPTHILSYHTLTQNSANVTKVSFTQNPVLQTFYLFIFFDVFIIAFQLMGF